MSQSDFSKSIDLAMSAIRPRKILRPGLYKKTGNLVNYYNTEFEILGLSVPDQRLRFQKGYEEIRDFNIEEQAEAWFSVWQDSLILESLNQAIFFFESWDKSLRKLGIPLKENRNAKVLWKYLTQMVDRCDNWLHSDAISALLSAALEDCPERLSLFKKWNHDKNPWRRRQSIISLHYYSRLRKKTLPSSVTLPLIEALLDDSHFYVQRAVGWALRECYNVDPQNTLLFLEKNITRVAPAGYYAATEKLNAATKRRLLEKRKKARRARPKI